MGEETQIAGVVVLFNPSREVLESVASYLKELDVLYAIDNTEPSATNIGEELKNLGRVIYIPNGGNEGIAKALNQAASLALTNGYDYLLTMDQDSIAEPDMVSRLLAFRSSVDWESLGILAPRHDVGAINKQALKGSGNVLTTMTSGNLLNLKAYQEVGPFCEELFIDYVDHEYCLRLQSHGYRVIEVHDAVLHHRLGRMTKFSILGRSVYVSCHPPIRRYYMTRNRFWLCSRYGRKFPGHRRFLINQFWRELLWMLLFEEAKIEKIKMMIMGYLDFRRGKLGQFVT